MRKIAFLILTMISMPTFAQDVRADINSLLNQIQTELSFTNDASTLERTKRQLSRTLRTLRGDARPLPSGTTLSCIARDNDGRDPWALGSRNISTFQTTPLTGSTIGSLANCEKSKNAAVTVGNSIFVCIARDNDGRDPFSVAHYKDNKLVSLVSTIGSLDDCIRSLNSSLRSTQAVAFCGTRDNDGKSPYIEMSVLLSTGQINRGNEFRTLDDCLSSM